jgi:hypothetical protein
VEDAGEGLGLADRIADYRAGVGDLPRRRNSSRVMVRRRGYAVVMDKLIFLLSATVLLIGCGSVTIGGTGTSTGSGGAGGSTGTHTGVPSCPAMEPIGGQSCAGLPAGLRCTYGTSVRAECRDVWICNGGIWSTTKGVCPMPPPADCGSAQPSPGTVCPTMGDVCTYGDTICICNQCPDGLCMAPPVKWSCAGPPSTPGCPPVVPNDGTACSTNGLTCAYGFPCGQAGIQVECTGGTWVWDTMMACPL